jgi:hypothetical protein
MAVESGCDGGTGIAFSTEIAHLLDDERGDWGFHGDYDN